MEWYWEGFFKGKEVDVLEIRDLGRCDNLFWLVN